MSEVVRLVERDRLVLWELERWRVMCAKEIKVLGGVNGGKQDKIKKVNRTWNIAGYSSENIP